MPKKVKSKNKMPVVCSYSRSIIYHCEHTECPYHILNLSTDVDNYYVKHHCQLDCKKFDGKPCYKSKQSTYNKESDYII